ncbi:hypothetical protein CsSME_00023550 [Camellia sinensis var. sinensis]|uniref:Gnk2-homologous domain-containing protein n=1 Tax=Camellia sinensis var. sinensis TaxID=542762 RepID=A0A4S4CX66_CAMSN|nr:hypothetical protein TEA_011484 [Camellia sinensis var. sinensis]
MVYWRLLFFLSHTLITITITIAQPEFIFSYCVPNRTNSTTTYEANLKTLFSSLSSAIDSYGFYNASLGQNSDRVNAIVLCRGDVELAPFESPTCTVIEELCGDVNGEDVNCSCSNESNFKHWADSSSSQTSARSPFWSSPTTEELHCSSEMSKTLLLSSWTNTSAVCTIVTSPAELFSGLIEHKVPSTMLALSSSSTASSEFELQDFLEAAACPH